MEADELPGIAVSWRVTVLASTLAIVLAACARKTTSQNSTSGDAPLPSATALASSAASSSPSAPPLLTDEQFAAAFETQRLDLERRLTDMKGALSRDDRPALAHALIYPARLRTNSGCAALVASPEQFLARYDALVTPSLRHAVLSAAPRVEMVRNAWVVVSDQVWFPDDGRSGGFVINTQLWSVPGLPCWNESPTSLPAGFADDWTVASTCAAEGPDAYKPDATSRVKRLSLDLERHTATFLPGKQAPLGCRVDRISESELNERWPMSIMHCSPQPWPQRAPTIHLDCRAIGERYVHELHLLGTALVQVGPDNHVLTFTPRSE